MEHTSEKASLEDYDLVHGLGDELTPDMMVNIWNFSSRRHLEAVWHWHTTGERIWAKTVNAGIAQELGIEQDDLARFTFAGMMIAEDRAEAFMTDEDRAMRDHVNDVVDQFMDEFDFDSFYAEKTAHQAEEDMLESMLNDDGPED
jgi:hypothetical protein